MEPVRSVGRPTRLTPAVENIICEAISKGAGRTLACRLAGVSYEAFIEWVKRDDEPFAHFRQNLERAENRLQLAILNKWIDWTDRDWRAGRDYLAMRWPEEYARPGDYGGIGAVGLSITIHLGEKNKPAISVNGTAKQIEHQEDGNE